jgi:glycerophosphoryl diester phosphodiesterase
MSELTQPVQRNDLRCQVIGHRGAAALCPENTLPSFRAARDAGAGMIELDVQQSIDGELIVFHDETLERLCGETAALASLTASELTGKAVGQWHGQSVTIPSLAQVFAALQRSVLYNVELKTNRVHYSGIEKRLVKLIGQYSLAEYVLVSSFNPDSLRLARQCDPHLSLGLLLDSSQAQQCGGPDRIVARAHEFSCFSVHPEFSILRQWPELGSICHAAGLRIFPWTVDNQHDWQFLIDVVHVDGIITNDPGRLYGWLRAQSPA